MKVIMTIAMLTALTAAARAEDKPAAADSRMPWEKACDADMKKLCKDVKGDVRTCLADHEKELSKECTKLFSAHDVRLAQLCEDDFAKFCTEAMGKGTLPQCVNANLAKFSPKCRNALTTASKKADEKAAAKKEKAAAKKEKAAAKEPAK
jgi:hypothetical protein